MADCFFVGGAAITRDERRMQRKEEKGRTKRDFSSCPVSVATSFKGVKGEKGEREQARFSCFCFLFWKKIGKLEAEAQKMVFFFLLIESVIGAKMRDKRGFSFLCLLLFRFLQGIMFLFYLRMRNLRACKIFGVFFSPFLAPKILGTCNVRHLSPLRNKG